MHLNYIRFWSHIFCHAIFFNESNLCSLLNLLVDYGVSHSHNITQFKYLTHCSIHHCKSVLIFTKCTALLWLFLLLLLFKQGDLH